MTQIEMCEMPFGSAQRGQDSVCHLAKWCLCARCPEKHPRAQQGPGSCGAASLLCCAGVEPGLLSGVGQCHTGPAVCGRNCPAAAFGNGVLPQCLLCFSAVSVVCVSVFPKPSASPWFLHLENGQTLFPLRVSLMVREHCIILLKREKMEK